MATFFVGSASIVLPAIPVVPKSPTRALEAWLDGLYITVKLLSPVHAIRCHTNGEGFSTRPASEGSGAWVALGDIIATSAEITSSRSLPGPFTHIGEAVLPAFCLINVGICSSLFSGTIGGGVQAEYVGGPAIYFVQLTGKVWHSTAGSA